MVLVEAFCLVIIYILLISYQPINSQPSDDEPEVDIILLDGVAVGEAPPTSSRDAPPSSVDTGRGAASDDEHVAAGGSQDVAGAAAPPPPPPPARPPPPPARPPPPPARPPPPPARPPPLAGVPLNRGFRLQCSDDFAYADEVDANLKEEFSNNAPPGYEVESVEPCIYPGKNAHRILVKYRSLVHRRCEEIKLVKNDMNNYKPQNSNIGSIAVVPGGYLVEYSRYCVCHRRSYRRRRWFLQPVIQPTSYARNMETILHHPLPRSSCYASSSESEQCMLSCYDRDGTFD